MQYWDKNHTKKKKSQTKMIAKHGLILAHLCVYLSIVVSIMSLIICGEVSQIASVALVSGVGFFGAGVGCKASKGFVTRRNKEKGLGEDD
ncbi:MULTISPECIES: hypothetical protein [unclassified Borrelia]|uniref:hypothetical protein n=1 Tax=unclassified Borrelia TaxID=2649934 RepID=UPI001E561713|nr:MULTISPECIES: hypothetical protein [unclassified Borrelia]UGQ16669.1 hypothetical protein LSO06_04960 [Borrelia sp. RT5S]UGQ17714.1 hypothetical protein LSO05_04625 [Borrelia sp. RT1S]UGQ17826.1 hypothetical protein LSO05_05190 [Borrelia sp. RT1S]